MLICAGMKLISGRISLLQQLLEKSVGGRGWGRGGGGGDEGFISALALSHHSEAHSTETKYSFFEKLQVLKLMYNRISCYSTWLQEGCE